jgi:hypothetical protein
MERRLLQFAIGAVLAIVPACDVSRITSDVGGVPHAASAVATVPAGWASVTGYNNASTAIQRKVVALAVASDKKSSGLSVVKTTVGVSTPWLTDMNDPEAARTIAAWNDYASWTKTKQPALATVIAKMKSEFSRSGYDAATTSLLTSKIIAVIDAYIGRKMAIPAPKTAQDIINELGIRAMCLEWAVRTSLAAGGKANGYFASEVADKRNFRPGMALYNAHLHAMIIVDIRWGSDGLPVEFKVAEANYGRGWVNVDGNGMVPWERDVKVGRLVSASAGYRVVDFEK